MAETNATPELALTKIVRRDAGLMWENACAIGRGYGVETPVAPPSSSEDQRMLAFWACKGWGTCSYGYWVPAGTCASVAESDAAMIQRAVDGLSGADTETFRGYEQALELAPKPKRWPLVEVVAWSMTRRPKSKCSDCWGKGIVIAAPVRGQEGVREERFCPCTRPATQYRTVDRLTGAEIPSDDPGLRAWKEAVASLRRVPMSPAERSAIAAKVFADIEAERKGGAWAGRDRK